MITWMNGWVLFGFFGQAIFASRFIFQWIASEKKKESFVPLSFWYLSIAGGIVLLIYALYKRDPVFAVGQASGLIVYVRNLMLIAKKKERDVREALCIAPAA